MSHSAKKTALFLSLLLSVLALASLAAICLKILYPGSEHDALYADIYQDGQLYRSIRLDTVTENVTFTVTASDGGRNIIEIRPGAIGITAADCPDRICVNQGFIRNSLLPITCLPHRLVIQIRQEKTTNAQAETISQSGPDMITY